MLSVLDLRMVENCHKKSRVAEILDISATRLSLGDPIGFPPHPHEWFSILVYHIGDDNLPFKAF
jgi:hypothetical protein